MEEMYVSENLSAAQIQQFLQTAMPGLTAFPWEMLLGEKEPMEFDSRNPTHIFFETTESEVPQFPQHVAIYRTPTKDEEARSLWLAQSLSEQFQLNVLVPFTHPEKPHYPFYDIVFQQGVSYLADDSATEFGEPDAKPVRLLGPYPLLKAGFDAFGRLIADIPA
ncbi:hypothetical protein MUN84_20950 [Hymenobacter sp. 5516J-16]|uniref:hypothetical protein n=1 Tax=Hymenobacter sp. 5516J-16 TaxID=2932253 RepID=UPI001FD04931|nr:hypothetical protein [Hymenobacter sp. 5516J-16]UOQ76919.1 hypothetical protein MUN84_20950 [Hymenobacter sp. 5516J-16]